MQKVSFVIAVGVLTASTTVWPHDPPGRSATRCSSRRDPNPPSTVIVRTGT